MNHVAITIISTVLIVFGTLGAVLPFLPGLPLALGGLILYALVTKSFSFWGLLVFTILTLLTMVADVFAPAMVAKSRKASRMGVMGAIIGAIVGMFFFPIGILLGPFIGAFIGEMMHSANTEHAFRVAIASLFGLAVSSVFKLIVGASMFVYFLIVLF